MCTQDKSALDKIHEFHVPLRFHIPDNISNKSTFILLHLWQENILAILDDIWSVMSIKV